MKSLLHRSKEKVGARCKRGSRRLPHNAEAVPQRLCSWWFSIPVVLRVCYFRKTTLKFSLPKQYKSSCENGQTAQEICLLRELSGGLSFQLSAHWAISYPIFHLVHNKVVLFISCSQALILPFLVPCLYSTIHPSIHLFICLLSRYLY